MARTELNKGDVEVDLDTDGIKSQDINVAPVVNETESKEVNIQKEEEARCRQGRIYNKINK